MAFLVPTDNGVSNAAPSFQFPFSDGRQYLGGRQTTFPLQGVGGRRNKAEASGSPHF